MEISGINRNLQQPLAAVAPVAPVDKNSEKREVIKAVKALNGTEMFGEDNELTFQRDPNTQRMVVQVVNRKTKEIMSQVPPEYVLRLAEDLKRTSHG